MGHSGKHLQGVLNSHQVCVPLRPNRQRTALVHPDSEMVCMEHNLNVFYVLSAVSCEYGCCENVQNAPLLLSKAIRIFTASFENCAKSLNIYSI